MRSKSFFTLFMAVAFLLSAAPVLADDDFPLRAKYPDVKVMSTDQLAAAYDATIIVDVRSQMEFDVAHVNKAKHVSLSKDTFAADLEKVRGKNDAAAMAFYCNGHTCAKSYKAAKASQAAGFENIYAYDAGIFDWINAQPDKATLMGKTPASKDQIIPKKDLKSRMLSYDAFKAKASEPNAMVIDIRDQFQREKIPDIPGLSHIPLDQLTDSLEKKQYMDKQLLILDAVGKQVRWLQYYLEEFGYTNYAFLEGGVKAIN